MSYWPDEPTNELLSGALRKGLGRCYLWAKRGKANKDVLLEACLNDYRFDRQVEDPRGDWLWKVIDAGEATEHINEPLLMTLRDIGRSDAQRQLCQLAFHYAVSGDERFRSALRDIVEKPPADGVDGLGEEEVIRLDGEAGFLLAARRHGAELNTREWEWHDGLLRVLTHEICVITP